MFLNRSDIEWRQGIFYILKFRLFYMLFIVVKLEIIWENSTLNFDVSRMIPDILGRGRSWQLVALARLLSKVLRD